jgi:formylglycine-generating enzyme required for sulfatase activity
MQNTKPLVIMILMASSLLFISCNDNEESTDNGPQGFTPAGMVLIHAKNQSFAMGSANGLEDEQPVHTVNFTHDFWMDTTEVAQSDYDSLMGRFYSGYSTPSWHNPYGVGAQYPAYSVSWGDGVLYGNARSKRDGRDTVYSYAAIIGTPGNWCELQGVEIDYAKNGYRLPTEAEWEYACRGGGDADFFWGKACDPYPATPADTVEMGGYAVWYGNAWIFGADSSAFGTHPVASKTPNGYGLHDIAGNLYEWCNDWYGEYAAAAVTDPVGPGSGDWHGLRGGSWGSNAVYLRSANRTFSIPDYIYYFVGFRVILPVP